MRIQPFCNPLGKPLQNYIQEDLFRSLDIEIQ